jgi:ABC-2 type transport system ATP-binding protein
MLQLTNIQKFYDNRLILGIPALTLENGFYWVKGANGSGKTTFLKMVAGLIPFKGDISFKGVSLRKEPLAYRQYTGWAEAEPVYPPFMTGMELISLYKRIRKDDSNLLPDIFNMKDYVNTPVGTYSAGMLKKLSLVLAFLGNPSLIILDEPTITLDPDAFVAMCTFISEQYKNSETVFLISSHTPLLLSAKELIVNNTTVLK